MGAGQRRSTGLARGESMDLLGSVSFGRIVFSQQALPAIRPVNHLVDNGDIIIRSSLGASVVKAADTVNGVVVAYEADSIDPADHRGWSVIVTGTAHLIRDAALVKRYDTMLYSWVAGQKDHFIRIHPQMISGIRLDG